jgi:putative DNA primase/helicase
MTSASEIIAGLGGNERTGMCRCPAHDDKHPSLSVTERDGKVLVRCFAGCSQDEVIAALRHCDLWGDWRSERRRRPSPRRQEAQEPKSAEAARIVRDAWESSAERPVEYLRSRGITYCPRTLRLVSSGTMRRAIEMLMPAMAARIERDGEIIGMHTTILTFDRDQNAVGRDGKNVRRTLGRCAGGIVRVAGYRHDPLVIAEGIETALAAMQLGGFDHGWAAIFAGNLPNIPTPEAEEITIAADRDPAGMSKAEQLADRLAREGKSVRVAVPPRGDDWNDELDIILDEEAA